MDKPRGRVAALLAVLAVVGVACGARVDGQQVQSLGAANTARPGSATDANPAAGPGAGTDAGATATTVAAAGGSAVGSAGGGAAATATGSGDNGGAVDVGITATTVTLGNVSTLSGPVPGLFEGSVVGAQAVVAYENSIGGLFGRKFKLDVRDDQFDTGQNRAQTADLITKAFAFMGSFSLYDDAAAGQIQASGIPDASYPLSPGRKAIANNFPVQPSRDGGAPTTGFQYFKSKFPDAVTKVGSLYGDVPASKISHFGYQAAAESVGWHWVYERGIQPTETDFTADVIRMKQAGVKTLYLVSTDDKTDARLAKAMQTQGFKPDLILANYYPTLPALAGSAVEGWNTASAYALFDGADAGPVPEIALMNQWIQKVHPGYKTDLFAVNSWAEGRMLFQAMQAAGPKAKRADVIAALRKITDFSANNMLSPSGPGVKRPSVCMVMAQIRSGRYVRTDPATGWICNGTYHDSK